ncbi:hypothetical protein D9M70_350590 [compost metagenome]
MHFDEVLFHFRQDNGADKQAQRTFFSELLQLLKQWTGQRLPAYSAESGHSLRRKLDPCSSANWTRVPDQTGHYGRSDAGSKFGFYSWSVGAVKRARIFRMESPFKVS